MSPAASVPGMLPSPASTATQNVRPMYRRPSPGSTGPTMISSAPASAQVPVAMPNAHCLMRMGSAPISASAVWSCATALMARPVKVRDRYSDSPTVSSSATPNATSIRVGTRMSPSCTLSPM